MYKIVSGSHGVAPRFAITCGLREGYGQNTKFHKLYKVHTADEVVGLVEGYLKDCAASGRPYLTGSVTTGTVVYAWPEGEGKALGGHHEEQATYSGEKNPLYNSSMTGEKVMEFLNGLAAHLGAALCQTRVYVAYNGDMWILQEESSETPTGEKVE